MTIGHANSPNLHLQNTKNQSLNPSHKFHYLSRALFISILVECQTKYIAAPTASAHFLSSFLFQIFFLILLYSVVLYGLKNLCCFCLITRKITDRTQSLRTNWNFMQQQHPTTTTNTRHQNLPFFPFCFFFYNAFNSIKNGRNR